MDQSFGKSSTTLIIPIEIARRHGLDEPSHVTVEERPDGILIRRLELGLKKGEFVWDGIETSSQTKPGNTKP
ncbi:MAG: AbrB/MazE/SpoVT family DNA-binding domain-containing protein [Candidatus Nitrosopolaris sp.]